MTCALRVVALIEGGTVVVAIGASGGDAGATGRCAARKVPNVGGTVMVGSSVEDAGSTGRCAARERRRRRCEWSRAESSATILAVDCVGESLR